MRTEGHARTVTLKFGRLWEGWDKGEENVDDKRGKRQEQRATWRPTSSQHQHPRRHAHGHSRQVVVAAGVRSVVAADPQLGDARRPLVLEAGYPRRRLVALFIVPCSYRINILAEFHK